MDNDFVVKLTIALYKVTGKMPEQEPLKIFIRKKALDILADSAILLNSSIILSKEEITKANQNIDKDIEILKSCFQVAQQQNWVDELNFVILNAEYQKIKREIEQTEKNVEIVKNSEVKEDVISQSEPSNVEEEGKGAKIEKPQTGSPSQLNDRQKKIIEILKQKQQCQVKDIEGILANVTKRTIRRDFAFLHKCGIVQRIGDKNTTLYKLIN